MIYTMLDNLFLNGSIRKMNKAIITDVNMRMGRANIGFYEKIPIMSA